MAKGNENTAKTVLRSKGPLKSEELRRSTVTDAKRRAAGQKKAARQEKDELKQMKPLMKVLKAVHDLGGEEVMTAASLKRQRHSHEVLGRLITPMIGMDWESFDLDGMPCAWTRPDRGHDRRHAILYCHGGGYTCGALNYSRILSSKLSHVTGYPVMSFQYRLAPEHPYPAAMEDGIKAWNYLMHLGFGARDVVIAGDSAGGNMALCLALKLKEEGRLMPRALILMSPWTDLAAKGKSYEVNKEADPTITMEYIKAVRKAYAGEDADFTDPHLSPLYAPLKGLPPTLIQVGDREILESDSVKLRDKLVLNGVPCRLEVWKDMFHVFQMFPIHQAAEAMDAIGHFLLEMS